MFVPAVLPVHVPSTHCIPAVERVVAQQGRVVSGQIIPAVSDVKLTLTLESENPREFTTLSDSRGEYRFPAIPSASRFHVSAWKEGYVFHVSPDGLHFSHQQLGSLRVVARDLEGNPIEGVLLALSSETASLTGVSRSDGSAVFGPLFPGRYYLHAQLKEFRFLPAGQTVDVAEGDESGVSLQGERIAFSAFGSVVTLTGQPLPRKKIIAESPAGIRESASTDLEGNFRVRGLKPGARFSLRVLGEEHVIPAVQEIEITAGDVRDVKFVSLRERTAGRVSGVVESDGPIPAGMKVVVEGKEGRKSGKVTRGGSFEVKEVKEGNVRVKVEGAKGKCEEIEREIRKNEANHVVLHCEAEKTAEMEVSSGGSFVILAIAMIALFGFMERELFYCSVCWNPVEGGGLDENDWEIGDPIGCRELLWVDWVSGGDVA